MVQHLPETRYRYRYMFASGPSPAVAYQLSLKLRSLLRLLLECASAHRGTGVAVVRSSPTHARSPALARARLDGTFGVMGGGTGVARWDITTTLPRIRTSDASCTRVRRCNCRCHSLTGASVCMADRLLCVRLQSCKFSLYTTLVNGTKRRSWRKHRASECRDLALRCMMHVCVFLVCCHA